MSRQRISSHISFRLVSCLVPRSVVPSKLSISAADPNPYPGAEQVSETRNTFNGPLKGTFDVTDTVSGSDRIWSGCGASTLLVVQNRGSLAGGGTSKTLYFSDGESVTTLESRAC